jgi:hypothetical protein
VEEFMTTVLSRDQQKLAKLLEIEGYDSLQEMAEAVFSDSVSPGICTNDDCAAATGRHPTTGCRRQNPL